MATANRRATSFSLLKCTPIEIGALADAFERANAQAGIDLRPTGYISVEPRDRGGRYAFWRRYDAQKRRSVAQYLGLENSEAHLAAQAQFDEVQAMHRLAKTLRAMGYAAVEAGADTVIAQLHNKGVFVAGGVLIGIFR